jgi:hypothetical protein
VPGVWNRCRNSQRIGTPHLMRLDGSREDNYTSAHSSRLSPNIGYLSSISLPLNASDLRQTCQEFSRTATQYISAARVEHLRLKSRTSKADISQISCCGVRLLRGCVQLIKPKNDRMKPFNASGTVKSTEADLIGRVRSATILFVRLIDVVITSGLACVDCHCAPI